MIRVWIFTHLYIFRDVIILSAKCYREHHISDTLHVVSYFLRFFSRMREIARNIGRTVRETVLKLTRSTMLGGRKTASRRLVGTGEASSINT